MAQDEPSFEQLIGDAKTAFDAEEYQKAIDLLLYAHRVQPNSRLLINVAKSYEKMDDCALALVYYRAYLRESDTEDSLVDIAEDAMDDADSCGAYDPSMAGRLIVTSKPLDATIAIDGKEVGKTPFEIPGLESGTHTVSVTLDGYEPFEESVNLASNADATVNAALAEEKEEVVAVAPTPEPDPITVEKKPGTDPMIFVAGGITAVGVGLLGMGMYMDLSAIPATDDERSQYAVGSQDYQDLTDQRAGQANLALVGYIGGSLLAVGGGAWLVYMLFLDQPAEAAPMVELGEGIDLRPVVRHDGGGFILEGSF